jgi:hypothetical protein
MVSLSKRKSVKSNSAEVRRFNFPSCVDCELRDTCDITESNDGCWGWCPSCADCLWAQDIVLPVGAQVGFLEFE